MDKKYAIFDMDGTLVDSMRYWKNLAADYLYSKGIKKLPPDLKERIKPMTMSQSAEMFINEFGIKGSPLSVEEEMNRMMDDHYINDIGLKDGVKEYISGLSRSGVRMCVASATAEELVTGCLSRLGIYDYFEFAISCDSAGVGKDSPDIYYMAADRLGADPKDIAVYEDALYAIRTARDAGFYVVGVYDDNSGSRWEKIRQTADETIRSWKGEIK